MKHIVKESVNEYLEDLSLEARPATITAYWYNMNVVIKYLDSIGIKYLEQLKKEIIINMIKHFKKTCKNVTINKRMRLLKSTFKFHNIKNDYLMSFRNLKRSTVHYDPFTESQLKKIMNYAANRDTTKPYEFTRVLIIYLLLDTGVRGSELLNIEIKNIDLDEKIIKLTHTKTGKQGYIFFSTVTKKLLVDYLNLQPKRKFLLWNYLSYKRYTYIHLRNFMDKLKNECSLIKCHTHMFRHTFGTRMHENGVDFLVLQELMRHENPEMTRVYTRASYKRKKKSHDNFGIISNMFCEGQ